MGRALQHLDLTHLATPWYEHVLFLEDTMIAPMCAEKAEVEACLAVYGGTGAAGDQEAAPRAWSASESGALTAAEAGAASVAKEAAFNLGLIFSASGNTDMAACLSSDHFPVI